MTVPLLLLSPDGSRDRAGVVTPTSGGTVTTVAGQYGNAWQFASGSGGYLALPHAGHIRTDAGTVAARIRPNDSADSNRYVMAVGLGGTANTEWTRLHLDASEGVRSTWRHGVDALINGIAITATAATWDIATHEWEGTTFTTRLLIKGLSGAGTRTAPYATFSSTDLVIGALSAAGAFQLDGLIESILIFDRILTGTEYAILAQPRQWTWGMLAEKKRKPGLMLPV